MDRLPDQCCFHLINHKMESLLVLLKNKIIKWKGKQHMLGC